MRRWKVRLNLFCILAHKQDVPLVEQIVESAAINFVEGDPELEAGFGLESGKESKTCSRSAKMSLLARRNRPGTCVAPISSFGGPIIV